MATLLKDAPIGALLDEPVTPHDQPKSTPTEEKDAPRKRVRRTRGKQLSPDHVAQSLK